MTAALRSRICAHLRVDDAHAVIIPMTPDAERRNVEMWIGFKHFNTLVELAISHYLRRRHADVRDLYWADDLQLQFVASRVRYQMAMVFGDDVHACVSGALGADGACEFKVYLVGERFWTVVTFARATYRAVLVGADGRRVSTVPDSLHAALVGPAA